MGARLLAIAVDQSPSMLHVTTPSRSSLPQGLVFAKKKKGPHPAKETAPEIGNLLTRGNHRQIPAPSGKRLAQKGFGSMNLEIDGHTDLAVLGDFIPCTNRWMNHWASRLFLKVIFKIILR